jgi:predicted DCC family thiol-disulfide oxidoreductase YuxK
VLLYDAGCRVCRFTARSIARVDRDRELAILPLSDPEATELLAALPEGERLSTWRLVSRDGSIAGYGSGLPALLASMHLTRPAAPLARRIPVRLLDRAYSAVSRNRGRLGKLVPDGPAPRRVPSTTD